RHQRDPAQHPRRTSARNAEGTGAPLRCQPGCWTRPNPPTTVKSINYSDEDHPMQRTLFEDSHHDFRKTCREFFERACVPHVDEWERAGRVSREAWAEAGKQGLLAWEAPEEYGGLGIVDFRFNAVLIEEFWATGSVGIGLGLQNEILLPYLLTLTTEEQR